MRSKPMILVALLLAAFLVNLDTTLVTSAGWPMSFPGTGLRPGTGGPITAVLSGARSGIARFTAAS